MKYAGKACRRTVRPFAPVLKDIWEMRVTIVSLVGRGLVAARPTLTTLASFTARVAWAATACVGVGVLFVCAKMTIQEMHESGVLSMPTVARDTTAILIGLLVIGLRIAHGAILNLGEWLVDLRRKHIQQDERREYKEACSEYFQIAFMDKIDTVIAKLEEQGGPIRLGLIRRGLHEMCATGPDRRSLQAAASVLDSMYDCPLGDLFDLEVSKGEDPRQLIALALGLD